MAARLHEPLSTYFAAANSHDTDATIALFAERAVVKDEGREHTGIQAIREWIAETTRKYHATAEALDVAESDGKTVVACLVSGQFKGSPVRLRYAFTTEHGQISRLEIV